MSQICYAYDATTGVYVGPIIADPSPLEPGVYLYPADTTLVAPPAAVAHQAWCWVSGAWTAVADHRGETWYTGATPVEVEQLGDPAAFTPPLSATATPDLAGYARYRQAAILAAGETFNVAASGQPAVNILCDGTNTTRADLALMVLNAQANSSATQTWIDNHGVSTVLSAAEIIQLAQLAGNWMSATYPVLGKILSGLTASPPTITTTTQIDNAFASAGSTPAAN